MSRIYLPLLAAIVMGLVSCKETDQSFSFRPMPDSLYKYSLVIFDSGGNPGNISTKLQKIEFSLQHAAQKDTLVMLDLVFEHLSIRQPGIQVASMKNGSIMVLPAGTYVTVSTDEVDTTAAYEDVLDEYYQTWKEILPKLRGDSLQITINRRGEVQQVTGFDKITERIASGSGIDIRTVRQYLHDYAGNESIKDLLNKLFFYLPGREIQAADHWVKNVTTTANAPIKQSHLINVTHLNKEEDGVRLSVKSVVSAKTSEEGRQYAEGTLTGGISASLSTGLPYDIYLEELMVTHTDHYDVTRKRTIYTPRF